MTIEARRFETATAQVRSASAADARPARLYEEREARVLDALDFHGAVGDAAIVGQELALGVGPEYSVASARGAGMTIGRRLAQLPYVEVDLTGRERERQAALAGALAEGALLGSYAWGGAPAAVPRMAIVVEGEVEAAATAAAEHGAVRGRAANLARLLTDTPPSALDPSDFAAAAGDLAREHGWRVESLDASLLESRGFPAILAVGAGSARPPWLIDLEYRGAPGRPLDVVLVGKGITMDCGGLNLKTERPIAARMKSDMAGGAAVIAAVYGASVLQLPVNVRVIVPTAENMPGGDAIRPGDVLTHRGGRRTEVTNTDAEGRLVLADCLRYGREVAPEAAIIDVGGLSAAPFAPAGWTVTTRDEWLGEALRHAASDAGELGVHVRLVDGLEDMIASGVADSQNFSYTHVGSDLLLAAAFLAPFAGEGGWAHVDILGSAYLTGPWSTWPAGATGSPTRPLISLLETWRGLR